MLAIANAYARENLESDQLGVQAHAVRDIAIVETHRQAMVRPAVDICISRRGSVDAAVDGIK